MGKIADEFGAIVCDPQAAVCDANAELQRLRILDARLDRLIFRSFKVLIKLAACVSNERWWPNQCIERALYQDTCPHCGHVLWRSADYSEFNCPSCGYGA